jgi:DNA-binding NarL/FixJ family response regulator
VTRALRLECPGVAIVALTAAAGNREMQAMLDAGAATCIRKDEPLDSIAQAVRAAAPAEAA